MKILPDDFFRPFDDPFQDVWPAALHEMVGVVFNVAFPFNLSVEGYDLQPPPCPGVQGSDLRKVVGVKN